MEFGHLFEALMLICFGFSWPLNVIKAYKARTAKGTSLAFIFLIITGYLAGITAKFVNHLIHAITAQEVQPIFRLMTDSIFLLISGRISAHRHSVKTSAKLKPSFLHMPMLITYSELMISETFPA